MSVSVQFLWSSLIIITAYSEVMKSHVEIQDQRHAPGEHGYCEYKL